MQLIDVQKLSEILGLTPQKVRELCEEDIIPYYNTGLKTLSNYRFILDEVLAALKNRKNGV